MTRVKAQVKWVRSGAQKIRRILKLIRRRPAREALQHLQFMPQKGARIAEKLIKSAVANAKHNHKMKEEKLIISEIFADSAAITKRFQPRARGRAFPIKKRTSHLTVYLEEAK
jgi:large subunit ribosomal protein L22